MKSFRATGFLIRVQSDQSRLRQTLLKRRAEHEQPPRCTWFTTCASALLRLCQARHCVCLLLPWPLDSPETRAPPRRGDALGAGEALGCSCSSRLALARVFSAGDFLTEGDGAPDGGAESSYPKPGSKRLAQPEAYVPVGGDGGAQPEAHAPVGGGGGSSSIGVTSSEILFRFAAASSPVWRKAVSSSIAITSSSGTVGARLAVSGSSSLSHVAHAERSSITPPTHSAGCVLMHKGLVFSGHLHARGHTH